MEFLSIRRILIQDYYAIPDYQRDYEWTKAEILTLVDDIYGIARDTNSCNHFFGAIVTIPYESDTGINKSIDFKDYNIDTKQNVKHIVDGQQRLTSFSVFICALKNHIENDNGVSEKKKCQTIIRQLDEFLLGSDYYGDNPAPRLVLNGNTGACYNSELLNVSTASFNKSYKGAKRLLTAYDVIYNEIGKYKEDFIKNKLVRDNEEYYRRVIDVLKNKAVFVEIECDASSDAFQ